MPSNLTTADFEWWILFVLPILTAAVLVGTLAGTALMARSAGKQAAEARRSADAAMRQGEVASLAQVRPLLSVVNITSAWDGSELRTLGLEIMNGGGGPGFNIDVSVHGYADRWRVSARDTDRFLTVGALPGGGRRTYTADPVQSGAESGFESAIEVRMECFDIMGGHFAFVQEFLISPTRRALRDIGLKIVAADESPASEGLR